MNSFSCVNAPTQWAGVAALTGPQDFTDKMIIEFDRRRKMTTSGLNNIPGITCIMPAGAFYVFPNISRTGWNDQDLAEELLEKARCSSDCWLRLR